MKRNIFILKSRYSPYSNWSISEFQSHLERQAVNMSHEYGEEYFGMLYDCINDVVSVSDDWDVLNDYDGCSFVQDNKHPDIACSFHDCMWLTGQGGYISDKLFLYMMRESGYSWTKRNFRFALVRIGWVFWYQFIRKKTGVRAKFMKLFVYLNNR